MIEYRIMTKNVQGAVYAWAEHHELGASDKSPADDARDWTVELNNDYRGSEFWIEQREVADWERVEL